MRRIISPTSAARPARLVLRATRDWPRPGRVANGIEIEVTRGLRR